MLYIIGLGLGDEKDITLRGLEAVQKCQKVFIEAYTSLLSFGLSSDGLSALVRRGYLVLQFFLFFMNPTTLQFVKFTNLYAVGKALWQINFPC